MNTVPTHPEYEYEVLIDKKMLTLWSIIYIYKNGDLKGGMSLRGNISAEVAEEKVTEYINTYF